MLKFAVTFRTLKLLAPHTAPLREINKFSISIDKTVTNLCKCSMFILVHKRVNTIMCKTLKQYNLNISCTVGKCT